MPPHIGVAERLNAEHEDDDRRARNPGDTRGQQGATVALGVGDHEQVGPVHEFCAPVLGAALTCFAQTLPGAQPGTGGSCTVASWSVCTKATLSPS